MSAENRKSEREKCRLVELPSSPSFRARPPESHSPDSELLEQVIQQLRITLGTYGGGSRWTWSSPHDSAAAPTCSLHSTSVRCFLCFEPRALVPEVSAGSPAFSNPINFGTLGPKISRSNSPTLGARPSEEVDNKASARFATVLTPC